MLKLVPNQAECWSAVYLSKFADMSTLNISCTDTMYMIVCTSAHYHYMIYTSFLSLTMFSLCEEDVYFVHKILSLNEMTALAITVIAEF
jgi:hypothetical protein